MTIHINHYFSWMDQKHGGEKEKERNYVCIYVMLIDIPGSILVFMAN